MKHDETQRRHRSMICRPAWLKRFEATLASLIPVHPNLLSALKLLVVTPALFWFLGQPDAPLGLAAIVLSFAAFAVLDYLDGVVARGRQLATGFGRVFDRVTDYPILIGVPLFCKDVIPPALIATKIALDLLLLALFLAGRGSTQNRLRTTLSYTTLLGLLLWSRAWGQAFLSASAIEHLLVLNIGFSAVVCLYNLDLLKKRHVANLLSFGNLACGALAILFAWREAPAVSLALLLVGLTFDGFDGVAARRWGSTSWGVYSDDVADAVNFALAPAAVLFFTLGGVSGALLAALYATCTIGRLVYFTLDKNNADPQYFSGVPSPVGGLITMCGAILFGDDPAVVGLLVGVACAQMVAFTTAYRHLGRLLARRPRLLLAVPALALVLGATWLVWGLPGPVTALLVIALGYAAWPVVRAFARLKPSAAPQS